MAIFNWLTRQLRADDLTGQALGEPVSIIGIDEDALSEALQSYVQTVDRLHKRVRQLDSLITVGVSIQEMSAPAEPVPSAKILHIFGDPEPGMLADNAVLASRRRLKSAFGG